MAEALRIIGFCIAAAIAYGVAHDQVTARVCIEYFTIGHPPLIPSESPTLLALAWGVVATWWVGLPLGVLLSIAARVGRSPALTVSQVRPSVLRLLVVMAACAFVAGVIGYLLAGAELIALPEGLVQRVPRGAHHRFLADLWAHSASYAVGAIGGLVVCYRTFRRRRRASVAVAPI